ncbi:helix-turn-helix domain-containing protein [Streptomyces sp. NPDC056672]|uniref:helix-turn-helix domain-containing protein n=1 Tax=Streptomyces sp. NPDC056672 TaxID=3345906 RepID=UPI0036C3877E
MSTASPPADQLLYTPKEAAAVLRYGRSTVYELMAAGVLKYVKQGRCRRIRRSDLEAYVNHLEPLPH